MILTKFKEAMIVWRSIEHGYLESKKVTTLVHKAHEFNSNIILHSENNISDVKCFLDLSTSLIQGSKFTLEVHGNDEEEAKKEMIQSFSDVGIKVKLK